MSDTFIRQPKNAIIDLGITRKHVSNLNITHDPFAYLYYLFDYPGKKDENIRAYLDT